MDDTIENEKMPWSQKLKIALIILAILGGGLVSIITVVGYGYVGAENHSWRAVVPVKLSWKYTGDDSYDVNRWEDVKLKYEYPTDKNGEELKTDTCYVSFIDTKEELFPSRQEMQNEQLYLHASFYMDYLLEDIYCDFKMVKGESFFSQGSDFEELRSHTNFMANRAIAEYDMRVYKDNNSFLSYALSFEAFDGLLFGKEK